MNTPLTKASIFAMTGVGAVLGLSSYLVAPRLIGFAKAAVVPVSAARPNAEGAHRRIRAYGDVVACELSWPKGQVERSGAYSFSFEERQFGHAIVSADLYVVQRDPSEPFDVWAAKLLGAGGPTEEQIYKIDTKSEHFRSYRIGSVWRFEVDSFPFPDDPLYLVARDSAGNVVQEVLFGPLYEDGHSLFSLKSDMDLMRKN